MATKIKRSLFIGLGGTGIKALVNTKRMFIETYGEVPPMVAFLGIDTDKGEYERDLSNQKNEKIRLENKERMPICVEDTTKHFQNNRNHFTWLPEKNIYSLVNMTTGAGQIRTNGRFAFSYNYDNLKNKIIDIYNGITNATIRENDKYVLLSSEVEIHLVFSVCGGTGAGTFIDMAYLLKQIAPKCKLTGYGVLPGVFNAMRTDGMDKVKPNAYAAIKDLDYLMHLDGSEQITFDYIRNTYTESYKPFNAFFFIDNRNQNLDTYTHDSEIAELLSLALVTSSGELSSAAASVIDNIEQNIMNGNMDVENKRAWVSGLGACEIVFRGKDLQKMYAYKSSKLLIDSLTNAIGNSDEIVDNWIDTVKIRENNNQDDVLDFLLIAHPEYVFTDFDDPENAKSELDLWLNNTAVNRTKLNDLLDSRCQELIENTDKSLKELLLRYANDNGGIGNALNILNSIKNNVNIFLEEMNNEIVELRENTLPKLQSQLNVATDDLVDYSHKFFKSKSTMAELKETAIDAATRYATALRDELRHQTAIRFFTDLKVRLDQKEAKLQNIKQQLRKIYNEIDRKIAEVRNAIQMNPRTFQINLAQNMAVSINSNDLSINDFMQSLSTPHKILDFDKYDSNELFDLFYDFCYNLNGAKTLGLRTVDDVINDMSEDDFKKLMKNAANKSEPLFRINYRGYVPPQKAANSFYIGVFNKENSRLRNNDSFKNQLEGISNIDFVNIGQKDRIILYRQIGVIPAFAIANLPEYEQEYKTETKKYDSHFDVNIEKLMMKKNFQINPSMKQDETLQYWVKGILFGLIKNEDGSYWLKNEQDESLAIDDYWEKLSQYRDDAFRQFKERFPLVAEHFEKFIDDHCNSEGSAAIKQFITDVKNNYLEKFSKVNMSRDEIKSKGNESVQKLITDEINFVKKEL